MCYSKTKKAPIIKFSLTAELVIRMYTMLLTRQKVRNTEMYSIVHSNTKLIVLIAMGVSWREREKKNLNEATHFNKLKTEVGSRNFQV